MNIPSSNKTKVALVLILTLTLLFNIVKVSMASPFTDVADDHWAIEPISEMYDQGVTVGYGDGRFGPSDTCTLGDFATFLNRYYFDNYQYTASENIDNLVDRGILPPGSYSVNQSLTRILAIETIVRSADATDTDILDLLVEKDGEPTEFLDDSQISTNKKKFVHIGIAFDVVNGYPDKTFKPFRDVTRAEAVSFLFKGKSNLPIMYGGDSEWVEPITELTADLKLELPYSVEWNYLDYVAGEDIGEEIILDASGSGPDYAIEEYQYEITAGEQYNSEIGNDVWAADFRFVPEDVNNGKIPVEASVTITDGEDTETATKTGYIDVEVTNEPPAAYFEMDQYCYATVPVNVNSFHEDYEDDMARVEWYLYEGGSQVGFVRTDFADPTNSTKTFNSTYVSDLSINENGGTITFAKSGNYTIRQRVLDRKTYCSEVSQLSDQYEVNFFVNTTPEPPVADFDVFEFAYPNEPVTVTDKSTDPNDDIVKWEWTKPSAASGSLGNSGGDLTFTKEGLYDITLKVTDRTNLSDTITKAVEVIPPLPVAKLTYSGTLKENRKVTLSAANSLSPKSDPIQTNRSEWDIIPMDGQSTSDIKIDTDTSTGVEKNVLFKKIGKYKVTLTVHNNYSDANPTHEKIAAIKNEMIIDIAPDLKPIPDFDVIQSSPNFTDNPEYTTITIQDKSSSPDQDLLAKYNYVLKRDDNENGIFTDDDVYAISSLGPNPFYTIYFEEGNLGEFQLELTLKEEFGQPTIPKFVTTSDRRQATIAKTFAVNWIPYIDFEGENEGNDEGVGEGGGESGTSTFPEWAYTDDTLRITTHLKDEEISSLNVTWKIQKANETTMNLENADINTLCESMLDNNGGLIRFEESGYYRLIAEVKDKQGVSSTFYKEIRIYPLPTAILKDSPSYRWQAKPWTAKENRRFDFNGNSSYADDYYTPIPSPKHPIDHSKDRWEIIPLDGQNANESIKISGVTNSGDSTKFVVTNNLLNEQMLFKQKGKYKLRYQITNTYGKKSPWVEQIITVAADTPLDTSFKVINPTYRDKDDAKRAELVAYEIKANSNDEDLVDVQRIRYRFDSDNDGDYSDETWSSNLTLDKSDPNNVRATFKANHVGKYQIQYYAKEEFGQPTISEFVTASDRRAINKYQVIEVDNIRPTVDFKVVPSNKVDIVFTIGEINQSKLQEINQKINNYVKAKLEANNTDYIDTSLQIIETSTLDLSSMTPQQILDSWYNYPGGGGHYAAGWTAQDNYLTTTENVNWTGFLNWTEEAKNTKDGIYEFKLLMGYHSDPQGWTFKHTKNNDGSYSFYAVEFDAHSNGITLARIDKWVPSLSYSTHGGPLYHAAINGQDGSYDCNPRVNNSSLQGATGEILGHTKDVAYSNTVDVKIVNQSNSIKIYADGKLAIDVVDSHPLESGTYGPYTASQFTTKFSNICIETGSIKTLDVVLKEPTWREESTKFVVDLSDVALPELNTSSPKYPVVLSRMLGDDLYFAELGTSTNRSQVLNFIADNDGKGTFIYNNNPNMDKALQDLGDYILSVVRSLAKPSSKYILLNEKINYELFYTDYEDDPQISSTESWMYEHDHNYFNNSLGQVNYNGNWLSEMVNSFNKVGHFKVSYRIKDNPTSDNRFDEYRKWSDMLNGKLDLYVHRKPIAQFSASVSWSGSNFTVSYSDTSYDLDHQFESGKGIIAREWAWKEVGADTWNSGKLLSGNSSKSYLVKLRVRDKDGENGLGVWSDDTVMLITSSPLPPIAQFTLSHSTLPQGTSLIVTDTSYDPNGDNIVSRQWKVFKDDSQIGSTTTTNPTTYVNNLINSKGLGDYKITLKVKDSTGLWSEEFSQTFTVIPVNRPPIALFNPLPNPVKVENTINWNENSSDPDGHPLSYSWQFKRFGVSNISDIGGSPSNTYNYNTKTPFSGSFKGKGLPWGAYQITLTVTDNPPVPPYQTSDMLSDSLTKTLYVIPEISLLASYSHPGGDILVGDTITLKALTSKEVTRVTCVFAGTTYTLNYVSSNATSKNWELPIVIPDTIADSGSYLLKFKAETNYGGNGSVTRTVTQNVSIDLVALKLINFRITDIVNHPHLTYPISKENCPVDYKTGYYVTFQINAKGDPTCVTADIAIAGSLDKSVDMTNVGSSGGETIWEGKYYSPSSLAKGTVISANLTASKGSVTYNYNTEESWDGRILIVNGTAIQDAIINRTN